MFLALMDDMSKAAAERVVQERMERLGLTNAELARMAGVDAGTIGDFIQGRRWPLPSTRLALEVALELKPGTLAAVAREAGANTPEEGVLLDIDLDDLNEQQRAEVIATAQAAALERARHIRAEG